MANLKELLFWEKYRPKNQKNMILLPRIESIINDGIVDNKIFYGSPGTGKSTLANILAKENSFIKINASKDNGVDVLRSTIDNYITTLDFNSSGGYKIIYLDEFDRASVQLQDALKGYVESDNCVENVRFIFTTNHIHKITKELRSRFTEVCFDPIGKQEREFMYNKQINYLRAVAKKEGFEHVDNKELFTKIVNKHFPDLRKSIELLAHVIRSNDLSLVTNDFNSEKTSVFEYILTGDINPVNNYDYVMTNFVTNFDEVFEYLGRPFFEYLKEFHLQLLMSKGASILNVQNEYNKYLSNNPDPIIHLINYIIDLKKIIKS